MSYSVPTNNRNPTTEQITLKKKSNKLNVKIQKIKCYNFLLKVTMSYKTDALFLGNFKLLDAL